MSHKVDTTPVRMEIGLIGDLQDMYNKDRLIGRLGFYEMLKRTLSELGRYSVSINEDHVAYFTQAFEDLHAYITRIVWEVKPPELSYLYKVQAPIFMLGYFIDKDVITKAVDTDQFQTDDDIENLLTNTIMAKGVVENVLEYHDAVQDHYSGYPDEHLARLEAMYYILDSMHAFLSDLIPPEKIRLSAEECLERLNDLTADRLGITPTTPGDEEPIEYESGNYISYHNIPMEYDPEIDPKDKVGYVAPDNGVGYVNKGNRSFAVLNPTITSDDVQGMAIPVPAVQLTNSDYRTLQRSPATGNRLNIYGAYSWNMVPQDLQDNVISQQYTSQYGGFNNIRSIVPANYFHPVRPPNEDDLRSCGLNHVRAWIALRGGFDKYMLKRKQDAAGQYVVEAFTGDRILNTRHYVYHGCKYLGGNDPVNETLMPENTFYEAVGDTVEYRRDYPVIREYNEQHEYSITKAYESKDKKIHFKDYSQHRYANIAEPHEVESSEVVANSLLVENALNAYSNTNNMLEKFLKRSGYKLKAEDLKLNYRKYRENDKDIYMFDNYESYGEFTEEFFYTDLSNVGGEVTIKDRNNIPRSPIKLDFKYCFKDTAMLKMVDKYGVKLDFNRPDDIELRKELIEKFKNKIIRIRKFDKSYIERIRKGHPLRYLYKKEVDNTFGSDLTKEEALALRELENGESYVVTLIDVNILKQINSIYVKDVDAVITRSRDVNGSGLILMEFYPHPDSKLVKSLTKGEINQATRNGLNIRYVNNKSLDRGDIYINVLGEPIKVEPEKDEREEMDGIIIVHRDGKKFIPVTDFIQHPITRTKEHNTVVSETVRKFDIKTISDELEKFTRELKERDREFELRKREHQLEVERDMIDVERSRIGLDRDRVGIEKDRVSVSKERLAVSREQLDVDNDLMLMDYKEKSWNFKKAEKEILKREKKAEKKYKSYDKKKKKMKSKIKKWADDYWMETYEPKLKSSNKDSWDFDKGIKTTSNLFGLLGSGVSLYEKTRKYLPR